MAFCMKCIGWGLMGEMYGFLYEMQSMGLLPFASVSIM